MTETVDLILTVGDSFISSTGKKFVKGDTYTVPKEEANSLMSVKGDYDVRFFKKVEGTTGKKSVAEDITDKAVLPTPQEIADSTNEANEASHAAALALDKADAIASATRGLGDEAIEEQLAIKARIAAIGPTSPSIPTGEIDTASTPKGRGRPSNAVAV